MSKPVPENAVIVVADGGKAILFRSAGTGTHLELHEARRWPPMISPLMAPPVFARKSNHRTKPAKRLLQSSWRNDTIAELTKGPNRP